MEFNLKDKIIDYLDKVISYQINLLDYAQRNNIQVYVNGNLNKGWKGNVVEHILNISNNNKKGSDYENLEIKTVPIIIKDNFIKVKETTCLSVIDLNSILSQKFEESDLLKKINKTLFILIDVSNNDNPHIHSTLYIDFSTHLDLMRDMKNDYNNSVEHILDNISSNNHMDKNFSGKLGKTIQPRPKTGKKGEYSWAFYMKTKVLENFLNPVSKNRNFKNKKL